LPQQRRIVFGDYDLLKRLRGAAWASFASPGNGVSTHRAVKMILADRWRQGVRAALSN